MTVQKPKTQAEAAIMRVIDAVARIEVNELKCRRVASDNIKHEDRFNHTEGMADGYHDAAEIVKDAIGIAVWTRLERTALPAATDETDEEKEADDE
jgi:hypothetical protein